jgi:hypothetical protein
MTTLKNPTVDKNLPNVVGSEICWDIQSFDIANTSYGLPSLVANQLIQVGTVPAGHKLVAHLSRISVPVLDSNGTPLGDWTLGTATTANALLTTQQSETAAVFSGEDFVAAATDARATEIGSDLVDVPIYIKLTASAGTAAVTGVIDAHWYFRAFETERGDVAVL